MIEAVARQTILHSTIYKRKNRFPLSAHDRRKSLYQAVSTPLSIGNRAGTAYLQCIKDGKNIDPPYNTGNDFVYRGNFTRDKDEHDQKVGVYDEDGDRLFRNTERNGRFHSDWCNMMYPRPVLARDLRRDDGVIFISIYDGETHYNATWEHYTIRV